MENAIEHYQERSQKRIEDESQRGKHRFFSKEGEKQDTPYTLEGSQSMNLEDLEYLKRDVDLNGTKRDIQILDSLIEAKKNKEGLVVPLSNQENQSEVDVA